MVKISLVSFYSTTETPNSVSLDYSSRSNFFSLCLSGENNRAVGTFTEQEFCAFLIESLRLLSTQNFVEVFGTYVKEWWERLEDGELNAQE